MIISEALTHTHTDMHTPTHAHAHIHTHTHTPKTCAPVCTQHTDTHMYTCHQLLSK